jgi:mono/diheme cytochrome c family protein
MTEDIRSESHPALSRPLRRGALAALPLALGIVLAASGASTAPGGYTAAQATAGSSVFSTKCSFCHTLNLSGGAGPALSGASFHKLSDKYKTAAGLYAVISQKMPLDAPGSLGTKNYLAVTAFLLSKNGYAAGSTALTPKSANAIQLNAK